MIVFIAGPYTLGDVAVNVRNAMLAAERVIEAGHSPYVPHYSHFQHLFKPHDYNVWTRIDNDFVHVSDALLRIDGTSKGADAEVKLASSLGIPVWYDIDLLLRYLAFRDQEMNNAPGS